VLDLIDTFTLILIKLYQTLANVRKIPLVTDFTRGFMQSVVILGRRYLFTNRNERIADTSHLPERLCQF